MRVMLILRCVLLSEKVVKIMLIPKLVRSRKVKILFGVNGDYSQWFMSKLLLNCHLRAFIGNKSFNYNHLALLIGMIR